MANIPEFEFDFNKVDGMDITEAVHVLFKQMQDHYNKHIKPAPILFGGKVVEPPKYSYVPNPSDSNITLVGANKDLVDLDAVAVVHPILKNDVDTETVTPKTINMKSFSIKDGKDLGLKEGETILKGITDKGAEIFDKLLPGYDQMPYGPVVQGESGRYNLNPKGK